MILYYSWSDKFEDTYTVSSPDNRTRFKANTLVSAATDEGLSVRTERYAVDGSFVSYECFEVPTQLGPKFRKVKTSFVVQIQQVSNSLTPNEDVSDYIPVW